MKQDQELNMQADMRQGLEQVLWELDLNEINQYSDNLLYLSYIIEKLMNRLSDTYEWEEEIYNYLSNIVDGIGDEDTVVITKNKNKIKHILNN